MLSIIWGLDEDPDGNLQHIAAHGLSKQDLEHVLENPIGVGLSHASGDSIVFGFTPDGRHIAVVFIQIDPDTVYPVTAFETPERQKP